MDRQTNGHYRIKVASTSQDGLYQTADNNQQDYCHKRHGDQQEGDEEIFLIAKLPNQHGARLIVGGLSETGTLRAAELLLSSFSEIVTWKDASSHKSIGNNPFISVISCKRNNREHISRYETIVI